jgi:hypothetical protein
MLIILLQTIRYILAGLLTHAKRLRRATKLLYCRLKLSQVASMQWRLWCLILCTLYCCKKYFGEWFIRRNIFLVPSLLYQGFSTSKFYRLTDSKLEALAWFFSRYAIRFSRLLDFKHYSHVNFCFSLNQLQFVAYRFKFQLDINLDDHHIVLVRDRFLPSLMVVLKSWKFIGCTTQYLILVTSICSLYLLDLAWYLWCFQLCIRLQHPFSS